MEKKTITGTQISMRWVLTWKEAEKDLDGLPKKRKIKARLVARGFEDPAQRNGELINTAKMALRGSNQILLSVAAIFDWPVNKIDIQTAFLKSDYMERKLWLIPPAEANLKPNQTWRCKKAIYGLSDAPSDFHKTMENFLLKNKMWEEKHNLAFSQTVLDPCLFLVKNLNNEKICGVISTHVDDVLISGYPEFIKILRSEFDIRFDIVKFESLPFTHCGIHISRDQNGIKIDQDDYCSRLEVVPEGNKMQYNDVIDEKTLDLVRSQIGKLTYLTYGTRPDLAAKVGEYASLVTKFTYENVTGLNKVINYAMKTQKSLCYMFRKNVDITKIQLLHFTDASFGGEKAKGGHRSRAGAVLCLSDGFPGGIHHTLYWGSRLLRRIAESTVCCEILAMAEFVDILPMVREIYETIFGGHIPGNVLTDSENLFSHIKKSTEVKGRNIMHTFAKIQELISEGKISNLCLIAGTDNPADPLTKGDRGVVGPLRSLLTIGSLPFINPFFWLKPKSAGRNGSVKTNSSSGSVKSDG